MVQVFTSSMVAMAVVGAASPDAAQYGAGTIARPYHWVGDHAMGIMVSVPAAAVSSASFTAVRDKLDACPGRAVNRPQ